MFGRWSTISRRQLHELGLSCDDRFTFDAECNDFAEDELVVDCASILPGVRWFDVSDLEIPLLRLRTNDGESNVIRHSLLIQRQRIRTTLQPGNLSSTTTDDPLIMHCKPGLLY